MDDTRTQMDDTRTWMDDTMGRRRLGSGVGQDGVGHRGRAEGAGLGQDGGFP